MDIKQFGINIGARKVRGSKSAVVLATGIAPQRYRRIEANIEVQVDVEEAYNC